jgi:hypothetical protein
VSNKSESGSTLRLSLEEESFHGEHLKGCLGGARAPKRRAERRRAVEGLLAVLVVPSRRPLCLAHGLSCHRRPPPPPPPSRRRRSVSTPLRQILTSSTPAVPTNLHMDPTGWPSNRQCKATKDVGLRTGGESMRGAGQLGGTAAQGVSVGHRLVVVDIGLFSFI